MSVYYTLHPGDKINAGDQVQRNGEWVNIRDGNIIIGMTYSSAFNSMRRKTNKGAV